MFSIFSKKKAKYTLEVKLENTTNSTLSPEFVDLMLKTPHYTGEFTVYNDGSISRKNIPKLPRKIAVLDLASNIEAIKYGKENVHAHLDLENKKQSVIEYNKDRIINYKDFQ